MHFVSAQTEEEQLSDICNFFRENLRESVNNPEAPVLKDFENKITTLENNLDLQGLLEYFISLKKELLTLPTSHKNS
jgi:hypothetical protein